MYSVNFAEIIAMLIGALLGRGTPITSVQRLFILVHQIIVYPREASEDSTWTQRVDIEYKFIGFARINIQCYTLKRNKA